MSYTITMGAAASKPTSSISNVVSRFAQVCKFRSIEVNDSHQIKFNSHHAPEHDGTDEAVAMEEEKCKPQAVKVVSNKGNNDSVAAASDVLQLFEIVSAFKVAYVQLQQAHVRYNPQKIEAADELAVRQLEALCKVKERLYKANQHFGKKSYSSSWSASLLLLDEIHIIGRALESLKLDAKTKNCHILCLRRQLLKLDLEIAELNEQVDTVTTCLEETTSNAQCLDFDAFSDVVKATYKSVHDFAKPLISLMKASGWNLDLAARSVVQDSVVFSKRCHKKYAFEAYIARRMFSQLESIHQHSIEDGMRSEDDPIEYLIKDPCSAFAKFCRSKYLLVVHSDMELSFFGNLDHRTLVSNGKHPRTAFYQAFAKMARRFWVLQGVAGSITPKAVMYEVKRGTEFSESYMDLVDEDMKATDRPYRGEPSQKVAFMVMPGFKVGNKVIKSLVYCSQTRS